MNSMKSFEPKWMTPPGATVLDLLEERGLPVSELAEATQKDVQSTSRLLFGVEPLTADWAERLSRVLGASSTFWLQREAYYRADLRRLCSITSSGKTEKWLDDLPLKDMIRFRWIEEGHSAQETVLNTCAFFGVTTSDAFERKYQTLFSTSAYRETKTFATLPSSVAAWLRQGEISAAAIDTADWNENKLRASLDEIRKLTREQVPARFLPVLEQLLANCGVAMVIARAPEGCRASGVTRFLHTKKALIQLSVRYLADDQFWFTVFHEIAHLLLHAHEELFLEGLEERNKDAETEANDFAVQTLFAKVGVESLGEVGTSKFDIARLARKAGIAPGIVVGQLQERGRIPFNHFNYMKARYSWTDY